MILLISSYTTCVLPHLNLVRLKLFPFNSLLKIDLLSIGLLSIYIYLFIHSFVELLIVELFFNDWSIYPITRLLTNFFIPGTWWLVCEGSWGQIGQSNYADCSSRNILWEESSASANWSIEPSTSKENCNSMYWSILRHPHVWFWWWQYWWWWWRRWW